MVHMAKHRQHTTPIRIALLASILIHGAILVMCGRMITRPAQKNHIRVDLVTLPAFSPSREIARPIEHLQEVNTAPVVKAKPVSTETRLPEPSRIRETGVALSPARTAEPIRHTPPPLPYAYAMVQDIIHGAKDLYIPRIPTTLPSRSSFNDTINDTIESYLALIYRRIEEIRTYPPAAKRQGIEGSVRLGFLLFKDGRLGDIKVTESSSYAMLDKAAIENVRAGDPYPPFPSEIRENSLSIEVPIVFRLMDTSTRN
jgi:protein TonB